MGRFSGNIYLNIEVAEDASEEVNIPDVQLRKYICKELDIKTTDKITINNILELKEIRITDSISDLTGLEYAKGLRKLSIENSNISDITPLKDLVSLESLAIDGKNIKDITPLINLENLEYLYLTNNKIEDIKPISNLTKLRYLTLDNNNISDLTPLQNNKSLYNLSLSNNNISDITSLSTLNLDELYLANNKIKDVSPLKNFNGWGLDISNNQISDISPLKKFTHVYTYGEGEDGYAKFGSQTITIDKYTSNNKININLGLKDQLGNKITEIASDDEDFKQNGSTVSFTNLSEGKNTRTIKFEANSFYDYGYYGYSSCGFDGTININIYVGDYEEEQSEEVNIPDENLRKSILLEIGKDDDEKITVNDMSELLYIDNANGVSNLDGLEYAYNLEQISIKDGDIKDFTILNKLEKLTSVSIEGKKIDNISTLDLSNCNNLTKLSISNTSITDITSIKNLKNIFDLSLANNEIKDFSPISDFTKTEILNLSGNNISDITEICNFSWFGNLDSLNLSNNKINNVSLIKNAKYLWNLNLSRNNIKDISELIFVDLANLDLSYNEISDISKLKGVSNDLDTLNLSNNKISDISVFDEDFYMRELNLSNNKISNISSLYELTNLNKLYLNSNKIEDIKPLRNLQRIVILELDNNCIKDISPLKDVIYPGEYDYYDVDYIKVNNQKISINKNTKNDKITLDLGIIDYDKGKVNNFKSADLDFKTSNGQVIFNSLLDGENKRSVSFVCNNEEVLGETSIEFSGTVDINIKKSEEQINSNDSSSDKDKENTQNQQDTNEDNSQESPKTKDSSIFSYLLVSILAVAGIRFGKQDE